MIPNPNAIVLKNALNTKPVIVLGIVKNIAKSLQQDIKNLNDALSFFREIHWFLVESDSIDNSVSELERIKKITPNFNFESLKTSSEIILLRSEKLAQARNKYLSYLKNNFNPMYFPYVVVADFNLLNNKLSMEAVVSSWIRTDWDVVASNQSGRYYDIWALRHPIWSPNDCWEHHEFLKRYIKIPEIVNAYSIRSRMIRIPENSEWIPVDSAFGGFAIYKSQILFNEFVYEGVNNDNRMVCEHVTLNSKIINSGGKIFINPKMINFKHTDHSIKMGFIHTILRILRYFNIWKLKKRIFENSGLNSK